MTTHEIDILEAGGVKPTANRILVLRCLLASSSPMSLIEIETELETLDRSSIQRVLTALSDHGLVHVMEDGRGVSKYEVCHSSNHGTQDDHHAHFYCEKCNRVYCLENIAVPNIPLSQGFMVHEVNFMFKGICPNCNKALD